MEKGWDLFLQAHDCLKGTAKPAHYVVLRNDFKEMTAQALESMVGFIRPYMCAQNQLIS